MWSQYFHLPTIHQADRHSNIIINLKATHPAPSAPHQRKYANRDLEESQLRFRGRKRLHQLE
jgi:hypothetical protein